jgi:predicted RNA-binding Zn-ribbon protein involved in translation (DUF1610 family)
MSGFVIFRCPDTGFNVQTRIPRAEQQKPDSAKAYESFSCPVCTRTHLIDPVTGRVLGQPD